MTTTEAAKRLKVTEQHVRRLIREGRLRAARAGKSWVVEDIGEGEAPVTTRDELSIARDACVEWQMKCRRLEIELDVARGESKRLKAGETYRVDVRADNIAKPKGNVCFADLTLVLVSPAGEEQELVTIRGCSLRQGDRGEFLGVPATQYTTRNGDKRWNPHARFGESIYAAALDKLRDVAWILRNDWGSGSEECEPENVRNGQKTASASNDRARD